MLCACPQGPRPLLGGELSLQSVQGQAQGPVQHQRQGEVPHGVDRVKGQAAQNPRQGHGGPAHRQVHQGAQGPEGQAVQPGENGPLPGLVHPAEQPGEQGQQRPDVQVHRPPAAKAVEQPLQQQEHPQGPQHPPAEHQGEQDGEQADQLDVGQGGQGLFRGHQHHPQQGHEADVPQSFHQ